LICLGLERLVNRGKGFLYAVTLGTLHHIQLLYFHHDLHVHGDLFRGSSDSKGFHRKSVPSLSTAGKFAFFSVWPAGVSAAVLLPEIFALQTTASEGFQFSKTFTSYFSIMDMLASATWEISTAKSVWTTGRISTAAWRFTS
jgi:uncharacterized membrane protein YfhO